MGNSAVELPCVFRVGDARIHAFCGARNDCDLKFHLDRLRGGSGCDRLPPSRRETPWVPASDDGATAHFATYLSSLLDFFLLVALEFLTVGKYQIGEDHARSAAVISVPVFGAESAKFCFFLGAPITLK